MNINSVRNMYDEGKRYNRLNIFIYMGHMYIKSHLSYLPSYYQHTGTTTSLSNVSFQSSWPVAVNTDWIAL